MFNTIYERVINKTMHVVIEKRYNKYEVCIFDYNACCCRRAMLWDEVFLWEYVPLFESASDAINFVNNNINNLI